MTTKAATKKNPKTTNSNHRKSHDTTAASSSPSQSSSESPTRVALNYKKRLEGVKLTPKLRTLVVEALDLATQKNSVDATQPNKTTASPLQKACRLPLSRQEAVDRLQEYKKKNDDLFSKEEILPLRLIPALQTLLTVSEKNNNKKKKLDELDQALRQTRLVYTPKPNPSEASQDQQQQQQRARFQQRLERLKLAHEQTQYEKLTRNIGPINIKDDDVTARSMTFAASVGLNMVVAPLSFGVLMYFFAGSLLSFFFPDRQAALDRNPHAPDVAKVIVGVVSGVLMLFIEMILFVIRTNELDRAMRRKNKKSSKRKTPFGYYTADMDKHFVEKK